MPTPASTLHLHSVTGHVLLAVPTRAGGGSSSNRGSSSSRSSSGSSRSGSSRSSSSRSSSSGSSSSSSRSGSSSSSDSGRSSSSSRSSDRSSSSGGSTTYYGGTSTGRSTYNPSYGGSGAPQGPFSYLCLLVLMFAVVGLIGFSLWRRRSAMRAAGGEDLVAPPPPPRLPRDQATAETLAGIAGRDPGFDEARFIQDVTGAYFQVQRAWTDQQPDLSRQVMADGIWTRHSTQIADMAKAGKRNLLVDLQLADAYIRTAATDEFNDTLTVRYYATGKDFDIDKNTGATVRGDDLSRGWLEDWVYQRSIKAVTKDGTLHHKCPNCGAPLDVDHSGTCRYCKVPVMAGKHDWVLTRIDQVFDQSLL